MVAIAALGAGEELLKRGILSPLNEPEDQLRQWNAAPVVPDLSGKTLGFLSNTWGGERQIMVYKRLRERFLERFQLRDAVIVAKEVHSRPASQKVIDALVKQCDAVITGVCG
jgi:hypothetical protein